MGTVASLIESARYDLIDYETGLEYDDRVLFLYVNRLIGIMDSALSSLRSDYVHGIEEGIDCVADQNYVDLTYLNNGQWDSIRYVWIGQSRKYPLPLDHMFYKRKFRSGDTAEPLYWSVTDKRLLWECDCDAAHTDLVVHYNKKHRDRLQSWNDTFTVTAATDVLTLASGVPTFVTGDGPFTVSTTDSLPGGLAASTNYWLVFLPSDTDGIQLATSKVNALEGSIVDITSTGSGTHTLTLGDDMMPYNGAFDGMIREMMVMHARAKTTGKIGNIEILYNDVFRKRAMEETIRRKFVEKYYHIDY